METDILKAFYQTLFRQLHHLRTLKDTIKMMYLQVLDYYSKNTQSTGKFLCKLLNFCIFLWYTCVKAKYC